MNNFQYAQPRSEPEILEALAAFPGETEVLAGGTDLVGLMKMMVVKPRRVVNLMEVPSLAEIERDADGSVWVGAAVRLADFLDHPLTAPYPAPKQVIQNISSIQRRAQGTVAGELCRRPACWYFRNGHGLLADGGRRVAEGDNRYHAILGNDGPAKFVSASRLAPSLIALGTQLRVIGPGEDDELFMPLEELYQTPRTEKERETTLQAGQVITHVILPPDAGRLSAAYEVRHGVGPDPPLAAAAVAFEVAAGIVHEASICLGHVAPTPWLAADAARRMVGHPVNEQTAKEAGLAAVAGATPLSENKYKVQLAAVAVERAILIATGLRSGDI